MKRLVLVVAGLAGLQVYRTERSLPVAKAQPNG